VLYASAQNRLLAKNSMRGRLLGCRPFMRQPDSPDILRWLIIIAILVAHCPMLRR